MLGRLMIAATIAATLPVMSHAQCRLATAGTKCVAVPQAPRPAPVAIGDTLERGEYLMLMNARYYGLPSARDGWVYMQIEREIYRVDWQTHEVLEQVTHKASSNWRRW